jgi:rubrerythrin
MQYTDCGGAAVKESVRQAFERGYIRETQAYLKYIYFARRAEEEALDASEKENDLLREAARLFRQAADQKAGHAEEYLIGLDEIGDTIPNLQNSIEAELNDIFECNRSASAARSEGLEVMANQFERIAKMDQRHVLLFSKLSERMQDLWIGDRLQPAASLQRC